MALSDQILLPITALPAASFLPVSYCIIRKELKRPRIEEPVFSSSQRLMFQMTWSEVSSSPFDHLTPLFRTRVQVLRSSLAFQLSSSQGRVTLSAPVRVR